MYAIRSYYEPKLVKYPTFDLSGEAPRMVPAYVYQPRSKGPHPVVIYVHGGPEAQYRVITSYSIHYTKLYERTRARAPCASEKMSVR